MKTPFGLDLSCGKLQHHDLCGHKRELNPLKKDFNRLRKQIFKLQIVTLSLQINKSEATGLRCQNDTSKDGASGRSTRMF